MRLQSLSLRPDGLGGVSLSLSLSLFSWHDIECASRLSAKRTCVCACADAVLVTGPRWGVRAAQGGPGTPTELTGGRMPALGHMGMRAPTLKTQKVTVGPERQQPRSLCGGEREREQCNPRVPACASDALRPSGTLGVGAGGVLSRTTSVPMGGAIRGLGRVGRRGGVETACGRECRTGTSWKRVRQRPAKAISAGQPGT